MSEYTYDANFYRYIAQGALDSAHAVLPLVAKAFPINSVVDFGCGQGAWLSVWKRLGVTDVIGIDGEHVDKDKLLIDPAEFLVHDLSKPVRLKCQFDLVQSLEVAEHLPSSAAETFVNTLVQHAPIVLFSAAVPGQGGEHHVNERPYEYWRDLFRTHSYYPLDFVRPRVKLDRTVEAWYRYNTLAYVERSHLRTLPSELLKWCVAPERTIPDVSPVSYRFRKAILMRLPESAVTALAVLKKQRFRRGC